MIEGLSMSRSTIPGKIKDELLIKSAGRCQYEGCNDFLFIDPITLEKVNRSYKAHIIADSAKGPRGDYSLSDELAIDVDNLMLLCDTHHRLIDREQVNEHPVERLKEMKFKHEMRIATLTSIQNDKQTKVLTYKARVGEHYPQIRWEDAVQAIAPSRYPDRNLIDVSLKNTPLIDHEKDYWTLESESLERHFDARVRPIFAEGEIPHLSVFAFAPQPLLIKLGTLLSDIPAADVYQLHREPPTWCWQETLSEFDIQVESPEKSDGSVALVFSLSADVNLDRITSVLDDDAQIWKIKIPAPNNSCLKTAKDLEKFRECVRETLNRIKNSHNSDVLHVFPVMPLAAAVELGRVFQPKAHLPLKIYDQCNEKNGFIPVLEIKVPVIK